MSVEKSRSVSSHSLWIENAPQGDQWANKLHVHTTMRLGNEHAKHPA